MKNGDRQSLENGDILKGKSVYLVVDTGPSEFVSPRVKGVFAERKVALDFELRAKSADPVRCQYYAVQRWRVR